MIGRRRELRTGTIWGACLGTAIVATFLALIVFVVILSAVFEPGTDSDDGPALAIAVFSVGGAFPAGALVALTVGAILVARHRDPGERARPMTGAVVASLLPLALGVVTLVAAI